MGFRPSLYSRLKTALVVVPLVLGSVTACTTDRVLNSPDAVLSTMTALPQLRELHYGAGLVHHQEVIETPHAFSSMYCSVGEVDLEQYGFVEKEYLQLGRANVYTLDKNNRAVAGSTLHEYATRLLVRYPNDAQQFSGRVYIDILNASSGIDLEDLWRRSSQYVLNNGHAYVGITSKSLTANALERFDPERYQDLQWQVDGTDENGLLWDMLSQLGSVLRAPGAGTMLGGLQPDWLYLTGQSQSGMVLNTYLVAFADRLASGRDGTRPLFDGYLNLVGPAVVPISSDGALPTQVYKPSAVPLINIMSEAEHAMMNVTRAGGLPNLAQYERPKDDDRANLKIRFYEVAGAPHADPTSPILPNNAEIGKANNGKIRVPLKYTPGQMETELNIDPFVNAALENLHDWAVNGRPAPPADVHWIEYDKDHGFGGVVRYSPQRDSIGNALGGLRSPQIDVPLHRFYAMGGNRGFAVAGSMELLSREQIQSLYPGGRDDYLSRFISASDALVEQRYLLPKDAANLKSWALEQKVFDAID